MKSVVLMMLVWISSDEKTHYQVYQVQLMSDF